MGINKWVAGSVMYAAVIMLLYGQREVFSQASYDQLNRQIEGKQI